MFEEKFKNDLNQIKKDIQSFNIDTFIKNGDAYYKLENQIKRIEKRGVKAKKQRAEIVQLVEKSRSIFRRHNLQEIALNRINYLNGLVDNLDLNNIKSDINSLMRSADEHCKDKQINSESVNIILFEDGSGMGNLSLYGFSGNGLPFSDNSDKWDDILTEGKGELNMTFCYEGVKEIEKKERSLPFTFISDKMIEYSDTITRLLLHKSLCELYGVAWDHLMDKTSIILNPIKFYHCHHDSIEIMIYKNETSYF